MEPNTDGNGQARSEDVFVHLPGDPLSAQRRVRVGASFALDLRPAGGYRWSPVESSDPQIAAVTCAVNADGSAHAVVAAHRPGQATLSATTSHTGDRFGPPTRIWRMSLQIET